MRFSTLTYLSVLSAAGVAAGMAQAADVAVPAEKSDAASWGICTDASPGSVVIQIVLARPP